LKTARKIRHFRPILNPLFTVTGKKSGRGLWTRARIHPSLTCAGSTESPTGSFTSTSNVGASNETRRPVERKRHTAGGPRDGGGSRAALGRFAGRMAQRRYRPTGRGRRRASAFAR